MRDKRVLVTGADGFIGSHLVEMLVASGAKVRALAQYNSFNSWGWLEDAPCVDRLEVVSGDIPGALLRIPGTRGSSRRAGMIVIFFTASTSVIEPASRT